MGERLTTVLKTGAAAVGAAIAADDAFGSGCKQRIDDVVVFVVVDSDGRFGGSWKCRCGDVKRWCDGATVGESDRPIVALISST